MRGYRASNNLVLRIYRLEQLGKTSDEIVKAGANRIDDISFGLRNDSAYRREALKKAVTDAVGRARAMAQAMQVRLAGVLEVRQDPIAFHGPRTLGVAMAESAATPVSPGQISVVATVTVHYRIEPE